MAAQRVSPAEIEKYLRTFNSDILRGAQVGQETIRAFPSAEGPSVADVDRPALMTFNVNLGDFRELLRDGRDRRALLEVTIDGVESGEDYSVFVFLNRPEATATTPYTDPNYLGALAFFCHGDPREMFCVTPDHPAEFQLDATEVVLRMDSPDERMTATFVLIPFEDREPRSRTMSIRGVELSVIRSIVRRKR